MDEDGAAAHRFFRAIEDHFIRLRGAPLLLSPADHLVARGWFEAGVPLAVITGALDGLFERRRERGTTGRVSSLRYCRSAVEKEWKRVAALRATEVRAAAPALDVKARLGSLAESLPAELPERAAWARRIGELQGGAEAVEERLVALDRGLLGTLSDRLSSADSDELERSVSAALEAVADRLLPGEVEAARERLRRQTLRQRYGVPLLTLFGEG